MLSTHLYILPFWRFRFTEPEKTDSVSMPRPRVLSWQSVTLVCMALVWWCHGMLDKIIGLIRHRTNQVDRWT